MIAVEFVKVKKNLFELSTLVLLISRIDIMFNTFIIKEMIDKNVIFSMFLFIFILLIRLSHIIGSNKIQSLTCHYSVIALKVMHPFYFP